MNPRDLGLPADYCARVKSVRERLGLTQVQFAARIGVSFATVNRWENGQTKPARLAWRQVLDLEVELSSPGRDAEAAPAPTGPPPLDFAARPAVVTAVAEANRLSYGHLSNPAFATEVSLIDPLPHQRIAVYERMLDLSPLRFLLADDAGAGKTIMTGLYLREVLARRLVKRVLVAPPAGLVGNWEREMRTLFSLPFRIVRGRGGARRQSVRGAGERPGDRERRHARGRADVRPAARGGGVGRGPAVRPRVCSTRRTSWPPTGGRTSPSTRRIGIAWPKRSRVCRPASRGGTSAGRRRTSSC